jgi:hypothetical protein
MPLHYTKSGVLFLFLGLQMRRLWWWPILPEEPEPRPGPVNSWKPPCSHYLYDQIRRRSEGGIHDWSYCIHIYRRPICAYESRSLSYRSDALNAFRGILGALVEFCQGRFTWALPDKIFNLALMWVPAGEWCGVPSEENGRRLPKLGLGRLDWSRRLHKTLSHPCARCTSGRRRLSSKW